MRKVKGKQTMSATLAVLKRNRPQARLGNMRGKQSPDFEGPVTSPRSVADRPRRERSVLDPPGGARRKWAETRAGITGSGRTSHIINATNDVDHPNPASHLHDSLTTKHQVDVSHCASSGSRISSLFDLHFSRIISYLFTHIPDPASQHQTPPCTYRHQTSNTKTIQHGLPNWSPAQLL